MAQILQQTFVITVSKLVRDAHEHVAVLDADQTDLIQRTLPGVVEELIADATVIVEAHTLSD
jgi:hypothetical protein